MNSIPWINVDDFSPNPVSDFCILIWLPKYNDPSKGTPMICHYSEIKEGLFGKVKKGWFSVRGVACYQPGVFTYWKQCDDLYSCDPPLANMVNEIKNTSQFADN